MAEFSSPPAASASRDKPTAKTHPTTSPSPSATDLPTYARALEIEAHFLRRALDVQAVELESKSKLHWLRERAIRQREELVLEQVKGLRAREEGVEQMSEEVRRREKLLVAREGLALYFSGVIKKPGGAARDPCRRGEADEDNRMVLCREGSEDGEIVAADGLREGEREEEDRARQTLLSPGAMDRVRRDCGGDTGRNTKTRQDSLDTVKQIPGGVSQEYSPEKPQSQGGQLQTNISGGKRENTSIPVEELDEGDRLQLPTTAQSPKVEASVPPTQRSEDYQYSATEFQRFLDTVGSDKRKEMVSPEFKEVMSQFSKIRREESLIDLGDSVEVPFDPQILLATNGEQRRNVAQQVKEQETQSAKDKRVEKWIKNASVEVGIFTDAGAQKAKFKTATIDDEGFKDEPGKFAGPPPKSRTITRIEKEALNKTEEIIHSTVKHVGRSTALSPVRGRPDTSKRSYPDTTKLRLHQYSVEYLLKLRHKGTDNVSSNFVAALKDIWGRKHSSPQVHWYLDFIQPDEDGKAWILDLIRSLYWPNTGPTPRNQKPEFSARRTVLVSGGEDFADLIGEQLSNMGTGRQVAIVHGDRSPQDNKTHATAFRNGARNILVCTFPWAQQFVEDNVGQIVMYRARGRNQTAGQARKAMNRLVQDIESAKATGKLGGSVMARVVFGPDEGSVAKSVANKLAHVGARCVTPLEMVNRVFPHERLQLQTRPFGTVRDGQQSPRPGYLS